MRSMEDEKPVEKQVEEIIGGGLRRQRGNGLVLVEMGSAEGLSTFRELSCGLCCIV
jgi:hypothetical protein